MKKSTFIASLLLCTVSACDPQAPGPAEGDSPVSFSVGSLQDTGTRAGELTDANLASMGVFAYYTGQNAWTTSNTSNFMFNQKVSKSGSAWTYAPLKYWPNTAGDKVSFFAYAPHAQEMTGLSLINDNHVAGYTFLKYTVPLNASNQTDLLVAKPLLDKMKGSTLVFEMMHSLTRVLVEVRCNSAITMSSVKLNDGGQNATLKLDGSNTPWSWTGDKATFESTVTTSVPANTTTRVAEFFLLPSTAASITVGYSNGGSSETKTLPLPATPAWDLGKTIAYTVTLETGSEATLTVKAWDTSTVDGGNAGQEVPAGTSYPYAMNGVVYESATQAYYAGQSIIPTFPGWYNWTEMVDICKKQYTSGPYPAREWRLPSRNEVIRMRTLQDFSTGTSVIPSTTYWTSEEIDAANAWIVSGSSARQEAKTSGARSLCIRDVGEITVYPTYRVIDGYNRKNSGYDIVYLDASTTLCFNECTWYNNGREYYRYNAAVTRCTNLRLGGYSDWRLPTKDELQKLGDAGEYPVDVVWTQTPYPGNPTTHVYIYSKGGWGNYAKDGTPDAVAPCVRRL